MPHLVDVKCPSCGHLARFEFAEVCRIRLKEDVRFFQDNDLFEYRKFQDSCGHYWHGALYFPGLHGDSVNAIHFLPKGYQASDWDHSKCLYRCSGWDVGSVRCEQCHLRSKHHLRWPEDAYFSISYRGHVLWAFNRESAYELNEFLSSKFRDWSKYRWRAFLMRVPTVFKTHKARETVTKQLVRLLEIKLHGRAKRAPHLVGKRHAFGISQTNERHNR